MKMLRCPECNGKLDIVAAQEHGSTEHFDEVSVQAASCKECSTTRLALYEESRRGAPGSEHVRHRILPVQVDPHHMEAQALYIAHQKQEGKDIPFV